MPRPKYDILTLEKIMVRPLLLWNFIIFSMLLLTTQNACSQEMSNDEIQVKHKKVFSIHHYSDSTLLGDPAKGPVYELNVYENGRIEFIGYSNVKTIGRRSHVLTNREFTSLIMILRQTAKEEKLFLMPNSDSIPLALMEFNFVEGPKNVWCVVDATDPSFKSYVALRHSIEKYLHSMQYRCPIKESKKMIQWDDICAHLVEF